MVPSRGSRTRGWGGEINIIVGGEGGGEWGCSVVMSWTREWEVGLSSYNELDQAMGSGNVR